MKVLILPDAEFKALGVKPKNGKAAKLPSARDLNAMARNGETPEAFETARLQLEAVTDAADQIRDRMHALISEADAVGVKPGAIARWSGYSARRVHQIARGGEG